MPLSKCETFLRANHNLEELFNTHNNLRADKMLKLCQVFLDSWKSSHLLEGPGSIFVAKEKEKIRIISKSLVSLQFIFKPKSHIFHFGYKCFLKRISHIPKTSKKTRFLCQNDPKNAKFNKFRFSCMSLTIKNCKFLKIPMGKLPRVYCMYEKNRSKWLKMGEKLLIQPRAVGGVDISLHPPPSKKESQYSGHFENKVANETKHNLRVADQKMLWDSIFYPFF